MRVACCLLLGVSSFTAVAQQNVAAFARQQLMRDSLSTQQARKLARTKNLPAHVVDSINKKILLLVGEEDGSYAYRASLNQQAAITTGAAQLLDESGGYQLSGSGITVGIWEDGLVKTHIELGNRILSKEGSNEQTHATHVAGTILASGINAQAKGMAPEAKAYTYFFDNDFSEMASLASADEGGLLFSNHSYGTVTGWSKPNGVWTWYGDATISTDEDYRHGFYNARSQRVDELAYLSPYYTIVWAAGNDRFETGDGSRPADCNKGTGYDCIIPDATGKNIITVGAVPKVLTYTSPASVPMSWFSSWGPTDDGRIKPDLVAAGVDVFSLSADGTNAYTFSTGTSMATPNVTGSLMLLQELNANLNAGQHLKASTLKALAIHTAKEAGPKPGPDYQFGWGLLDVKAAADVLLRNDNNQTRVLEARLHNKETHQFTIEPKANTKITLTLCWTDPAGTSPAASLDPLTSMLVHDLDVRLIDEDGVVTLPWVLNPSVPQAQATTGDNTRDNVEKIELETPLNKTYTVLVRHKNELQHAAQDFSLVVTYTAKVNTSRTYYWVGGNGQWQEAEHWSLTSGGVSANQVPGADDIVIIDENSLANGEAISLTTHASAKKIVWLNSTVSTLNLQAQTLTIGGQLILSNKNVSIVNGTLAFNSAVETGIANFFENDLSNTDLLFTGHWNVSGTVHANRIELNAGMHQWQQVDVEASTINILSNFWNIAEATITVTDSLVFDNTLVNLHATNAELNINTNAYVDWKGNAFTGKISLGQRAETTFAGGGSLQKMIVAGTLSMQDSFTLDTVHIEAGATWQLASGKQQTIIRALQLAATPSARATLQAAAKSTLVLDFHEKLCFDYLTVRNIDVVGTAVVNVGQNSVLENAENWLQLPCEEVLFANFSVAFPCANGLTHFTDLSEGSPTSWQWQLIGTTANSSLSTQQHPSISFLQAGDATATLTIENTTQKNSVSKTIAVAENSFLGNQVIVTTEAKLMSLLTATHYQWYRNLEALPGETSRVLESSGEPGAYQVVVQEGRCNRLSDAYVVTATEPPADEVSVFPNPANNTITVRAAPFGFNTRVSVGNGFNSELLNGTLNEPMDIAHLPPGLYFIQLKTTHGARAVHKLVIAR
jgi:subtilisin family serine protease/PKD repeat protein